MTDGLKPPTTQYIRNTTDFAAMGWCTTGLLYLDLYVLGDDALIS